MNKTLLIGTALAVTALGTTFGALAQPSYEAYRDSQEQARQQYQPPQPGSEHYNPDLDPRAPQYNPNNVPPGHAYANDPRRAQSQSAQQQRYWDNKRRAWSYGPRYSVGAYAPEYREQRYWVHDWRARRLSAPPRGYQWVQTDTGDLLLMAIASGLIANVIISQR